MYKKLSVPFHGRELSIEAGRIAKQASGAVVIRYGDTVVLCTAVAERNPGEPGEFAPLTVNYQEKFYSSGKIPGGFFKREGRPTDVETLTSRLIDRPIRPLFPKGWTRETQIIPTVLSTDNESHPGVLSLIGSSAALEISNIPFDGPIAAVQVGRIDGEWIINPSYAQIEESDVELIIAGGRQGITMVEGGADIATEEDILEAVYLGYESLIPLLDLQDELRQAVGVPKDEAEPLEPPTDLVSRIEDMVSEELDGAWRIPAKMERHDALRELWTRTREKLEADEVDLGPNGYYFSVVKEKLSEKKLRGMIVSEGVRADGRDFRTVRQISSEVGVLPRTHGSAIFTRGETQAIVVVTLGTRKDERKIERLEEDYYKTFYLHYNFPPFSVGETKFRLGPGRREIGHGHLAERAIARVLPAHEDFPYTLRVVSDITESNGSSSMATVCGASLALMDAGVPLKGQVAGVAMGLVKEDEGKFHVLTDIMGDEDHAGDMDFKVAGTAEGVTAVQMDIKISGVEREIMKKALEQAREARLFILDRMNEVISEPRADLSPHAPRIITIQIPVDKIRDLIGPGGKTIRGIIEQTGAQIDVEDDGTVRVASSDMEANQKVLKIIKDLTAEPEVGEIYTGVVRKVMDFGAFVEILPGTDGLVHISQLENRRVEKVTDVLREGDQVTVKCIGIDPDGKVSLSRKEVLDQQPEGSDGGPKPRDGERPRDEGRAQGGVRPPPGTRPYSAEKGGGRSGRGDKPGRGPRDKRKGGHKRHHDQGEDDDRNHY